MWTAKKIVLPTDRFSFVLLLLLSVFLRVPQFSFSQPVPGSQSLETIGNGRVTSGIWYACCWSRSSPVWIFLIDSVVSHFIGSACTTITEVICSNLRNIFRPSSRCKRFSGNIVPRSRYLLFMWHCVGCSYCTILCAVNLSSFWCCFNSGAGSGAAAHYAYHHLHRSHCHRPGPFRE